MPQTVLRGPNGGPAIDQATGTPLTMEEMLRRNGIVQMGNTTSMVGPSTPDPASAAQSAPTPASGPTSAVSAAMAQRSGTAGVSPTANPNTAGAQPTDDPQMAQLAATGTSPDTVAMLEKAGLVAAGTAAAYGAYRLAKGMMGGVGDGTTPTNAAAVNGSMRPATDGYSNKTLGYDMPNGEYTEHTPMKRVGNSTRAAIAGRSAAQAIEGPGAQKALPAPQGKLANNGRTATAEAMAARAAQGATGEGVIAGAAPATTLVQDYAKMAPGKARPAIGVGAALMELMKRLPK